MKRILLDRHLIWEGDRQYGNQEKTINTSEAEGR